MEERQADADLTELYAKLLGLLLEHWVTLEGCWADPRRSLFKARQVLQWTVSWLVLAIRGEVAWRWCSRECSSIGIELLDRQATPLSEYLPATGRSKALRFLA